MTKRFRFSRSLDAKMLGMALLALLCALLVYLAVYNLSGYALDEIYMSPESVSSRQAELYADFCAYISENQIRGDDGAGIARWPRNNKYITLVVFQNDEVLWRIADGQIQSAGEMTPYDQLLYASQYSRIYPVHFEDGSYTLAIGDDSDIREDTLNWIVSLLLGGLAFFVVMLLYIQRLTSRIIRLSRQAQAIGAGDLEHPITVTGEDELSSLATEVDEMRHSVIRRMGNERRAWQANTELITAISHDIRTPMTALIGYLDLLNQGKEDPRQEKQFIASAREKAMELKELTDELFRYFLVFGKADLELELADYDAIFLLQQLLGEAAFDLQDAGFTVRQIGFEGEAHVLADPMYLKRVLDNLVSNIKKYADREKPVLILSEKKDGQLFVCVSNYIARSMDRVESTKIGLRTCQKIMEAMGGSFVTRPDEEHFAAEFSLPLQGM